MEDQFPSAQGSPLPHILLTDLLLLAAGPILLAALAFSLPVGDGGAAGVAAEVVGYSATAVPGSNALLLGDSVLADVRLAGVEGRGAGALLIPPERLPLPWRIASSTGTAVATSREGAPRTSVAPWQESDASAFTITSGRDTVYLSRVSATGVMLRGRTGGIERTLLDPVRADAVTGSDTTLWVLSCPAEPGRARVWWGDSRLGADATSTCRGMSAEGPKGWKRVKECAWWRPRQRVCRDQPEHPLALLREPGAASARVLQPREQAELPRLWVRMRSASLEQLEVGSRAGHAWTVLDSTTGKMVAVLGQIQASNGAVVSVGPHTFVIRTHGSDLDLMHARRPGLPAYLPASAGSESYHPAWLGDVPRCGGSPDALRVRVVHPPRHDPRARPREPWIVSSSTAAQALERVVELEGGIRDSAYAESVVICAGRISGRDWAIRLRSEPSRTVEVENGAQRSSLPEDTVVRVGREPGELLLRIGGVLLRVAPSRAGEVQSVARTGGGLFLGLALLVQSVPLTIARRRRGRFVRGHRDWGREMLAPTGMGAATCMQLVMIAISTLLFVGLAFQMYLSTHPHLAATPTYGQSFIQAMVLTVVVLCFAAWFTIEDGGLAFRIGMGLVGVALAILLAIGWFWLDLRIAPSDGMWLSRIRDMATVLPSVQHKRALLAVTLFATVVVAGLSVLAGRALRTREWGVKIAEWALGHPVASALALTAAGTAAAGILYRWLGRGALALHLSIMAGLAWYAAVHWDQTASTAAAGAAEKQSESVWMLGTGVVVWVALVAFLFAGAGMPNTWSLVSLGTGALLGAWVFCRGWKDGHDDVIVLVFAWAGALTLGIGGALVLLDDMGSLAAWIPAVLSGFFLWAVQTEEAGRGELGVGAARVRFGLALASGLMLLGALDTLNLLVDWVPADDFERARQRFALVENAAYPTAGEWITQVRWLASEPGGGPRWVPNLNSDLAVFGVSSNFGLRWAFLISLILVSAAFVLAFAADQALREASLLEREEEDAVRRDDSGTVRGYAADAPAVLLRGIGLMLGMTAILLPAQWLVHLGTGVAPQMPITGLVFPWVSHGTTTHLLYASALVLPLAAWSAAAEWRVSAGGSDEL